MFVSVDGKAKEVKEIFAGGADGLAHKVNEVFGSVDGVAKLVFTSVPHEKNAFDDFTWAEIKQLADEGRLLEYFKKGDKVDIKFKEVIKSNYNWTEYNWMQDAMTMQIAEVTATGMRLVGHTALPLLFTYQINNDLYKQNNSSQYQLGAQAWCGKYDWGLCSSLYNACKKIDNVLPDDFREILYDYNPLYVYENYVDHEGKTRLRKTYDDCRVFQVTTCGYEYHREFIEENDRYEYILDFTHFPRSEVQFKKFFPEEVRKSSYWNKAYGVVAWRYYKYANSGGGYWQYKTVWNNPVHSWKWDWENYDNWNNQDKINDPVSIATSPGQSAFVPEVLIGTI